MQEEKTSTVVSRCSGSESGRVLNRGRREEESDSVNSAIRSWKSWNLASGTLGGLDDLWEAEFFNLREIDRLS